MEAIIYFSLPFVLYLMAKMHFKGGLDFVYIFFMATILSLYGALNSNLPDYEAYRVLFNSVSLGFEDGFYGEAGYFLLSKLISFITQDYMVYRYIFSVIFLSIIIFVYKKVNISYSYSIFFFMCYLFYIDIFLLRHLASSSLILLSLYLLSRSKVFYSFLAFIFSVTFHYISLVFLPVYILYILRNNNLAVFYWIFFGLASFIALTGGLGNTLANLLIPVGLGRVSEQLFLYTDGGYSQYSVGLTVLSGTVFFQVLVLMIFLIFFKKIRSKYKLSFDVFFSAYFLAVFYFLIFIDFSIVAGRSNLILLISLPVLVSFALGIIKNSEFKNIVRLFFLLGTFSLLIFLPRISF